MPKTNLTASVGGEFPSVNAFVTINLELVSGTDEAAVGEALGALVATIDEKLMEEFAE